MIPLRFVSEVLGKTVLWEERNHIAFIDSSEAYNVWNDGMPFVYYNQNDSRWGDILYGKTNTISGAGCGPTSLAIVVSTLTSEEMDPIAMSAWAYENGYRCEGGGSYHELIPEGAEHYGLKVSQLGYSNADELTRRLEQGELIVALMGKGHFTKGGHFIVLRGINDEGKVLVADCNSYDTSGRAWDMSVILDEVKYALAGGPFWSVSK